MKKGMFKKVAAKKERRETLDIDELTYQTIIVGDQCWSPGPDGMWAKYKIMKHSGFIVNVKDEKSKRAQLSNTPCTSVIFV